MTNTYDKIEATARAFFDSYAKAFETKNAADLSAALTPDCIRSMEPKNFAKIIQLDHDQLTNEQYEKVVSVELGMNKSGRNELQRLVIDPETKSAAVRMNMHNEMKNGDKYKFEFIFMLEMNDACDRVKHIIQFADTVKIQELVADVTAAAASQQ